MCKTLYSKGKQLIPWKVIQKEIEEFNTYRHEALRARFRDFDKVS